VPKKAQGTGSIRTGAIAMRCRTKLFLAVIGVALVLPFAQIGLIAAQAQYFANGRPYCIEVSGDHFRQYRPVGSLLELNGLTLEAPYVDSGGSKGFAQWTFHALLAIDTGGELEWRNWSYWNLHFDRLTPYQTMTTGLDLPYCQLQADFVLKLPLLAKQ
jgi:hypothetical protein